MFTEAERRGRCAVCDGAIVAGDVVADLPTGALVHGECHPDVVVCPSCGKLLAPDEWHEDGEH